jgi:choline monooxygenase
MPNLPFDPSLPLEKARTIPADWYFDPDIAGREAQSVFGNTWQLVGRRAQLEAVGSFVTADIAGESILVIRAEDGVLRAFFNVCRHRAAPLFAEECGHAAKIRCRYHGWTYDLAGKLRGTPEFDGVEDFRKEENGLVPVTVAEWGPFVWVHLSPPTQSLEAFLDPLPHWSVGKGFESMRFARRVTYDLHCNWKVYVDNYLDGGYHVNTVHPALAGVLDYTKYRTILHENCSVQVSPLVPGNPDNPATSTRTGTEASYWWVFPNFTMNCYDGVMDTNLVLPLGPEKCRVIFDYYFSQGTAEEFIERSVAVADQVQREDVGICEEVQRGLHSRSYSTGRFSVKRENGGYHFHRLLAGRMTPA